MRDFDEFALRGSYLHCRLRATQNEPVYNYAKIMPDSCKTGQCLPSCETIRACMVGLKEIMKNYLISFINLFFKVETRFSNERTFF